MSSTGLEVYPQECHSDTQASDCVNVSENVSKGEKGMCHKVSDQMSIHRDSTMVKSNNTGKTLSLKQRCVTRSASKQLFKRLFLLLVTRLKHVLK